MASQNTTAHEDENIVGGSGESAESDDCGGPMWGNILLGAAIGVVVGGALGLLFAPKAGGDLRADLGGAVDDLKDRAEQMIDDLQASATDVVGRSRDVLDRTRDNLARSVEAGKDAYLRKKDELNAELG